MERDRTEKPGEIGLAVGASNAKIANVAGIRGVFDRRLHIEYGTLAAGP